MEDIKDLVKKLQELKDIQVTQEGDIASNVPEQKAYPKILDSVSKKAYINNLDNTVVPKEQEHPGYEGVSTVYAGAAPEKLTPRQITQQQLETYSKDANLNPREAIQQLRKKLGNRLKCVYFLMEK
jgi:hypothetical protein